MPTPQLSFRLRDKHRAIIDEQAKCLSIVRHTTVNRTVALESILEEFNNRHNRVSDNHKLFGMEKSSEVSDRQLTEFAPPPPTPDNTMKVEA
jgi:hypothetical protein